MLNLLVVSSSLLVAVLAQEPPARPICCSPPRWEAGVGEAGGVSAGDDHYAFAEGGKISFDYENKMYAHVARYMSSNGQIGEFKHIHNYNTRLRYSIYNGECNVSRSDEEPGRFCIPGDASMIAAFSLGAGERNTLPVTSYFRAAEGLAMVTTVTTKGCIPVTDTVMGNHHGAGVTTVHLIGDVTPGILDPSVFTPPRNCRMVPSLNLPASAETLHKRVTQTQ